MIDTSPNSYRCELSNLPQIVDQLKLSGDIIEFGTYSCGSAMELSQRFPDRKIITIDHFQGLEETQQNIPVDSGWTSGAFALDNPDYQAGHIPKNADEARKWLEPYTNVELIVSDIHDLTHPYHYGILQQIAVVNMDVDIYEPCVSALEFIVPMTWNQLFIRFDDWHGGDPEYDNHERLAFTQWIEKYNYQFEITHGGYIGGVIVKR